LVRALYPNRSRALVYVPGNRDFYSHFDKHRPELRTTWEGQRLLMPEVARELSITLLDDSAVEIEGILFLGATLWTDMTVRLPYNDAR
jgi:hypothetical protein